jgi:DNA repair protein RecO (recombination protein O)
VAPDRTQAVVLRNVDYSESSRIVTFACPDRGRMACMAKGAQRPKSATRGLLDTFNHVEIVYYWKDARSIQTLGEVSLLNEFRGIKSDLAKSAYGAFVLELADRMMQDNEPSHELFATMIAGLEQLNTWNGDVRTHGCWQALGVLRAGGHAPSVDVCHQCGGSLPAQPWFSYAGGFACGSCRGDVRLPQDDATAIAALVMAKEACPAGIIAANRAFDAVRNYARRQVETDFRSTRVIEQLYG